MESTARFPFDPRLSALLGESRTSSERAHREVVDNASDAEPRVVKIMLADISKGYPPALSASPPTSPVFPSHEPRTTHRHAGSV